MSSHKIMTVVAISGTLAAVAVAYAVFPSYAPVQEPSGAPPDADARPTPAPDPAEPATLTPGPSGAPYSDPKTTHGAVARHNMFAVDMYRQIAADPDQKGKNVFFSPFSMYMAFSFLYEGARGETASQMERVFGFYSDDKVRHEHVARTMSSINRDDPHATLETANALWLRDTFVPYDTYTGIVRDTYLADIEALDFNDGESSANRINDWAANKTHDKITKVIDEKSFTPLTMAVLNNAIYFKGTWVTQFDPDDTKEDTFWKDGNTAEKADFMRSHALFNYTESNGVQVLKMPYEGDRLSMLVVLPSERNGISQLEETISAEMIDTWRQRLQPTEVAVSMPKFKAATDYALNDYLKNLGMPSAFNPIGANFSGIVDLSTLPGSLYVSAAYQNAFVDVNEEGTEAAAVTTIIIATESAAPRPVQFTADRPFIFAIQDDESGTLLFMGRFSAPGA